MRGLVHDILLPRTDAGVAVQVAIVLVVFAVSLWRTRADRDLRLFTVGVGTFVLGLMMMRAAH